MKNSDLGSITYTRFLYKNHQLIWYIKFYLICQGTLMLESRLCLTLKVSGIVDAPKLEADVKEIK